MNNTVTKRECDCLNTCGDDSDIAKGLVSPCLRHPSRAKDLDAILGTGEVRKVPALPQTAILKIRKHGIELALQLDTDGKYFIANESL